MTIPQKRLKIALVRLGWSEVDLAQATGRAVQTIRNVVHGSAQSASLRAKIEAVLKVTIWSDPVDTSSERLKGQASNVPLMTLAAPERFTALPDEARHNDPAYSPARARFVVPLPDAAEALCVSPSHLRRVLTGERRSPRLASAYDNLIRAAQTAPRLRPASEPASQSELSHSAQ